jgi:dTDP-4-amino-4,6-dideoxygalactose transaminase
MIEHVPTPSIDTTTLTFPVWPRIPDEVAAAVVSALQFAKFDSSLLSSLDGGGPVGEFEAAFAKFVDTPHALAVNSGASALHLALIAARIKPGDEIILPAYGWGQILTFIDALDAIPVFADIEPSTLGLSPTSVAKCLTERTRAIVVTHFAGLPVDLETLLPVAAQVGAIVIEDCAQALGAKSHDRKVGTTGHIGVFSFGPRKHLTCGEGGALVTNDSLLWQRAVTAGQHPDRATLQVTDPRLLATELFWPYRMHPLAAVMGLALLPFMSHWANQRDENHQQLCAHFKKTDLLQVVQPLQGSTGAWGGLALTFQSNINSMTRLEVFQRLNELSVPVTLGPVGVPLHQRPEVVERWGKFPECPNAEERCAARELMLRSTIGLIGTNEEFLNKLTNAFWLATKTM